MYDYTIAVIGAGPGGLVVAIGAAKAGKKVVLIDKGTWGGDCTNFGCIPSKALIASARAAHTVHQLEQYGIEGEVSALNTSGALQRAREIVQSIRKEEEPPALAEKGVDALTGEACFVDKHTLEVHLSTGETKTVTADQIVIATGTHARIPEISGISDIPYLTNEKLFLMEEVPRSLIIIGGGPIGAEMGQAFRRLGSEVTIVQQSERILTREDHDASEVVMKALEKEGVDVRLNQRVKRVARDGDGLLLEIGTEDASSEMRASHILIAAGRQPNTASLQLDRVGVHRLASDFLKVDAYGRTEQKNIWAVGDVNGWWPFTHAAEHEARTVLTNLLLPWPVRTKIDRAQCMPRVTYTDPELSQVGMREHDAIKAYGRFKVVTYRVEFNQLDRARTSGHTQGFIKLVTKKWSGRILGATIVGEQAGELISEVALAIRERVPARRLSSLIHPYPTLALVVRQAADGWLKKTVLPILGKWFGSTKTKNST